MPDKTPDKNNLADQTPEAQHDKKVKRSDAAFDFTTAETDTETGNQNLPDKQDHKKSIQAITVMYEKGLMNKDEYESRLRELEKELDNEKGNEKE